MKFAKSINYVSSALKALEFYKNAFGFEIEYIHDSQEYGELNTGDTILAFASDDQKKKSLKNVQDKDYLKTELQFITNDVSAAFKKAVLAGGVPLKHPIQKPTGQTVALIKAIDGTFIELITPPNS
jgi:uncharacterized glyoxalase superfamily protein PhnB